jgi:hypothetical protein
MPAEALPDPAALAQQHEAWLAALEDADAGGQPVAPDPAALGRHGARDGALFVLASPRGLMYTPVADFRIGPGGVLEDRQGNATLGFSADAEPGSTSLGPIVVAPADRDPARVARYELDEHGVLWAIQHETPQNAGHPLRHRIARLGLAVFPAAQNLRAVGLGDLLQATPEAGRPFICVADAPGVPSLEGQPDSPALARLRSALRETWMAANRAETQVALAQSRDALDRIALDVVK